MSECTEKVDVIFTGQIQNYIKYFGLVLHVYFTEREYSWIKDLLSHFSADVLMSGESVWERMKHLI